MDINKIQFNKDDFDFVKTAKNTDEVLTKLEQNKVYGEILSVLADGNVSMELRKRIILRAVDETWVNVIEDSLPALDEIVRRPARYLEENELLLPVELTRKVTPRTVQHLSQHTGLITEIRDDDTIIPSKLLNVFRDETMNTYENRFINTLLSKLFTFVTMRYDIAESNMQDTTATSLTVDEKFDHGKVKGKIKLFIELEEPYTGDGVEKNYLKTTDLWRRIQRLYNVAKEYMASDFAKAMGKLYIRPPVMRTNAILKNKNLRQCLALWQFIETYTQTGCAYQVTETLENVSPEYVRDLYSSMAVDYAMFRYRTENGFDENDTIAKFTSTTPLNPTIVDELKPTTGEEYDYHYDVGVKMPCTLHELTPVDEDILQAVKICLDAYDIENLAVEEEAEEEVVLRNGINRSFMAKLIQASSTVQGYYTAIKNEFLSYKKVKSRISWNFDSINRGRLKLGKFAIRGKTLVLYLNLDPNEFDQNKYHHKDASDVKKFAEVPFMLRIRSERALKYALELIGILAEKFALTRGETATEDYRLPYESDYKLFLRGLIKVYGDYVVQKDETIVAIGADGKPIESLEDKEEAAEEAEEAAELAELAGEGAANRKGISRSFTAKLIQANDVVQGYYTAIKNEFLSYKKVKSRISWNFDSFNRGRLKLGKLAIRGKTLVLYLDLDPNEFDQNKYHHKDASDVKRFAEVPFMLRIRSERALRYAIELIGILAEKFALTRGETATEDYRLPFESDKKLLERGLIKVYGDYVVRDDESIVAIGADGKPIESLEEKEEAAEAEEEVAAALAEEQPAESEPAEPEVESISEDDPLVDILGEQHKTIESGKKVVFVRDGAPVVLKDDEPKPEPEPETAPEAKTEPSSEPEVIEEPEQEAVTQSEPEVIETPEPETVVQPAADAAFEAEAEESAESVYDAFSTVRYRRSFTAKMVEADEETKYYYSVIKSEMLRSKIVKWRISWGFDTFNIGREKLARMTVIGKTLVLYLNLDPAAYSESKYHHTDASDVSKVKDTPLMLKVRSERALKHALELIFDLYAKYELMINNVVESDWTFPPMSFEEMLEKGFIRLEGNVAAPEATNEPTAAATDVATDVTVETSPTAVESQPERQAKRDKKLVLMRARKKKSLK